MVNWSEIDTVLLDMDGTLLDLHFDNYFWQEWLPARWGELNGLEAEAAKQRLLPHFRRLEGTLSWYCVDYWSEYLDVDILALKSEVEHLIRPRPHAEEFLAHLNGLDKELALVTNAHADLIELKFSYTRIGGFFEHVFCAHHLGAAKEEPRFWDALQEMFPFDPGRTLLIDDNTRVLRCAGAHGIAHLLSIVQPDSSQPPRPAADFPAVDSFRDLVAAGLPAPPVQPRL